MRRLVFHRFLIGDCEDPELYAAQPLSDFMKSEKGVWAKEHCDDIMYRTSSSMETMSYEVVVYGEVSDIAACEYYLRWQ